MAFQRVKAEIKTDALEKFVQAFRSQSPQQLSRALVKAFAEIGQHDMQTMKARLSSGKLKVKSRGLFNSFKAKAYDKHDGQKGPDGLRLREYTGWKAASIFQTGGTITPRKSRFLTILTDAGRKPSGRRKYTRAETSKLIDSGDAFFMRTKKGFALVKNDTKFTKSGKHRKGSKNTILAWLRPRTRQIKRLDFFENFEQNASIHDFILSSHLEEALREIARGT